MMTKVCRDCKRELPLAEFHYAGTGRQYRQSYCKPCVAIRWAKVAKPTGEQRTARRHNITVERLREILSSGCGVCGQTDRLDIDHDHNCCPGVGSCGECVRGALCRKHNMALGMLDDDLNGVMRLVGYLKERSRNRQIG